MSKKKIAIIGGGPAAIFLGLFLDPTRFDVTIFEKNKALGRKFLVAGKGGFNLTHSEEIDDFISRYHPKEFLEPAIMAFNSEDLRNYLDAIGIPTFIGTSKRVFPQKGIKPIFVFMQLMSLLQRKGVHIEYDYEWDGWSEDGKLLFNHKYTLDSDFTVFSLGGGSWKVTGSDGGWSKYFENHGVKTLPFVAANCAFQIQWPRESLRQISGKPLKNITITCDGITKIGEVVITDFGMEGNAIYALSKEIQNLLRTDQKAMITIDLKPVFSAEEIKKKLEDSKDEKVSNKLRNSLKLSNAAIHILKINTSKEVFLDYEKLSHSIKNLNIEIIDAAPIDEAISTMGGISLNEVDEHFQLLKLPNHYCIGEMLDWNAPTGGYLLQACFSMGVYLAKHLNHLDIPR